MHRFTLETPRLILRPLKADDAEAAFVWLSDPAVNRFMPYSLYTDVEDVRKWIASLEDEKDEYTFGIVRLEDGLLIGSCGIGREEDSEFWNFGYNLRADCWNSGYATEAAQALICFAQERFGAMDFAAEHAKANPASGRVMEKCGLTYARDVEYSTFDGSETFPARRYEMRLTGRYDNSQFHLH